MSRLGFLSDLESRIEGALRRIFPKRSGDGVQPVEIARRLARAMEEEKRLSVHAVYVPNAFIVRLHPDDFTRVAPVHRTIVRDMTEYLRETAEKRGLSFAGPVEIDIRSDSRVGAGDFAVDVRFRETGDSEDEMAPESLANDTAGPEGKTLRFARGQVLSEPPRDEFDTTKRYGVPDASSDRGNAWSLSVRSGPDAGARFDLDAARSCFVGRSHDCDFVLRDPKVSRMHAVFRYEGDGWVVEDLGSTNGTLKEQRRIDKERLAPGDVLTMGQTAIEFERREEG